MSRDPEDGDPIDPASLHKYLYANGDPVNGIDPTGRADDLVEFGILLHKAVIGARAIGVCGALAIGADLLAAQALEGKAITSLQVDALIFGIISCGASVAAILW